MKKNLLMLLIVTSSLCCRAQFLTQSGDGKGSFLFKGSNIAFDVGKTDLSFTVNNLNRPVDVLTDKLNHRLMWGATVGVKNEDGTGNLFSSGDFTAAGTGNVYVGYQFANTFNKDYSNTTSFYGTRLKKIQDNAAKQVVNDLKSFLKIEISKDVKDAALAAKIKKDWFDEVGKGLRSFQKFIQNYSVDTADGSELLRDETLKEIGRLDDQIEKVRLPLQQKMNAAHQAYVKNNLWKLSLFAFTGIEGTSFKRLGTIDDTNYSKSFIKETFQGSKTGVGINYQVNRWKFGATYAFKVTNNLATLSKKDYKIVTTTSSSTQTMTQETLVSAYVGEYAQVELMELNIDAIYTSDLGKDAQAYMMINPYYRGALYSRNQKLLPSTYDFGLGLYFFSVKSKFLGGLYVEWPDADNSIEKNKPVEDQNIRPVVNKLTFGVVAKFSIRSLIASQ